MTPDFFTDNLALWIAVGAWAGQLIQNLRPYRITVVQADGTVTVSGSSRPAESATAPAQHSVDQIRSMQNHRPRYQKLPRIPVATEAPDNLRQQRDGIGERLMQSLCEEDQDATTAADDFLMESLQRRRRRRSSDTQAISTAF